MRLPLEGVKVLDLSQRGPGPFCTMMLGDLGAEVTKIEPPAFREGFPSFSTVMFPSQQFSEEDIEREYVFLPSNRHKKSICLNLRYPEGKEIFYKLASRSDIIVESFRPGVTKRLAIDYPTISKLNPKIIYCSITGYGQDGPYQDLPGHDINYIALSGALSLISTAEGTPVIPLNLLGDYAGGSLYALAAILAALLVREKEGKGSYIDLALVEGVIALMSPIIALFLCHGLIPQRTESLLTGGMPCYNIYQTKDNKYVAIGCIERHFWENLCQALGREDFIPYQFADGDKKREIFTFLQTTFRRKTRDEWFNELKDKQVCISKVYTIDEVCHDPQVVRRELVESAKHPKFGQVKQLGTPLFRLIRAPEKIRSLGSFPGQNTSEILFSLGYSEPEIQSLQKKGII